jgi:hypothetical protein
MTKRKALRFFSRFVIRISFVIRHLCFVIHLVRHFVVTGSTRIFSDKICCDLLEARLVASKFFRLFWGEQPPFTPIGCGGR